VRGVYHLPGMLKEDLAGRRERDLALGTVEQFDAKLLFQSADRRREGRLHDVDSLGCPGEVQLGGHGDEVLQVANFHFGILSRFAIVAIFFFRWT
jgi:hypothetical protein